MTGQATKPEYIVGIGASAGGLEALERFFRHTEQDERLAYIVVQHLSPNFKSLMDELLAQYTDLDIVIAEDGIPIRANTIYLIPAKVNLTIGNGHIHLSKQRQSERVSFPIDTFFRSLGIEMQSRAIGVILSGTGSDGTEGIQTIKAYDGLTIVQEPDSASFPGMPVSAIETGMIDMVAPPADMPLKIRDYLRSASNLRGKSDVDLTLLQEENALSLIFALLRREYRIDFSEYKLSTMMRRVERRIIVSELENISDYLQYVRENPEELDVLFRDLLVEVTHFFRDQEAFRFISSEIVPRLVAEAESDRSIRVWVPGCATGEEAYSLAMLFHEYLYLHKKDLEVKIFATDVHQKSLDYGSRGIYSEEKLGSIPQSYLERFFTPEGDRWVISRELRKMVIFAHHNLIQDPPFTRLNFITCRNVLIYFRPTVQKKVLSNFHFALKKSGILFLGPSENTGDLLDEFDILNRRWRIYAKKRDIKLPAGPSLPLKREQLNTKASDQAIANQSSHLADASNGSKSNIDWQIEIMHRYVPTGFLVSSTYQMIHIFGDAGKYLQPQAGKVNFNIISMIQGRLNSSIRAGLHRANQTSAPVTYKGIRMDDESTDSFVDIMVDPIVLGRDKQNFFMVAITPHEPSEQNQPDPKSAETFTLPEESLDHIALLERELQYAKEHLQTTIEELETTNEELQSTNEELIASNEELQSTNEELHSVNEELYTVNSEYQLKINELTKLNNDMRNLQRSSKVCILFLDRYLRIRDFTPQMASTFNLLPQDVGRPVEHLLYSFNISRDELSDYTRSVLDSGQPMQHEIEAQDGIRYLMNILPYKIETGSIEGIVLYLTDITKIKLLEADLLRSEKRLRALLSQIDQPVIYHTSDGEIVHVNHYIASLLRKDPKDLIGISLKELAERSEALEHYLLATQQDQMAPRTSINLKGGDGTALSITLDSRPIFDEVGNLIEYQGVGLITTDSP